MFVHITSKNSSLRSPWSKENWGQKEKQLMIQLLNISILAISLFVCLCCTLFGSFVNKYKDWLYKIRTVHVDNSKMIKTKKWWGHVVVANMEKSCWCPAVCKKCLLQEYSESIISYGYVNPVKFCLIHEFQLVTKLLSSYFTSRVVIKVANQWLRSRGIHCFGH